jgi:hypothetical protein
MPLAGGFSDVKDATPEIQAIADLDSVKSRLLQQMGMAEFETYKVVQFRQQVVAGMVYDMKILVSSSDESEEDAGGNKNNACLHVKVFQPLPHEQQPAQVMSCEVKTLDDTL